MAFALRQSYTFLGSFQQVFKPWQSQKPVSHRPLLLGSNFSLTKADKKRNVFGKTSIKNLLAAEQGFCETNAFSENVKNFCGKLSAENQKYSLWKSLFNRVPLKCVAFPLKK